MNRYADDATGIRQALFNNIHGFKVYFSPVKSSYEDIFLSQTIHIFMECRKEKYKIPICCYQAYWQYATFIFLSNSGACCWLEVSKKANVIVVVAVIKL